MLELCGARVGYDDIEVLYGVDMHVDEGEIVVLIGLNSAGKTTTVRTIRGILPSSHDEITYRDKTIHLKAPHEIVERDIVQVPEDRDLFTNTTVTDNLLLGAQTEEAEAHREKNLDRMLGLFLRLAKCKNQRAGTMSGGEQQMLTFARAPMGKPDPLILDELSIGLAPYPAREMFDVIEGIHAQGMTVLTVEQNVQQALKLADRGCAMENGHISVAADGDQLLEDEGAIEVYPGI